MRRAAPEGALTSVRNADHTVALTEAQAAAADSGLKAMMPMAGAKHHDAAGAPARPFLDYVLSGLADVGVTRVLLVLAPPPEQDAVRTYYAQTRPPTRVTVDFAVQHEPLGTANAVVAAADALTGEPFLVLNADNYYPRDALQALVDASGAATIAFDADGLVRDGNITHERVRAFAMLDVTDDQLLRGIVEKPSASLRSDTYIGPTRWVGMNCWRITPDIVDACRRVAISARGEYELPEAVALAVSEGVSVQALCISAPVLDLSQRTDIADVAARLAHVDPNP